jgi:hypothetical protein
MTITTQLTYWVDIDRPYLGKLNPTERIDWFEHRVRLVLITPIERIIKTDHFLGNPDSSMLLIVGAAVCNAIEAMGHFVLNGRSRRGSTVCFEEFVKRYMHKDLLRKDINGIRYWRVIWENVRCGLSHGFCIKRGGFDGTDASADPYFVVDGVSLKVNPYKFYYDFRDGFELYLSRIRKSKPTDKLHQNFQKAFERIFIKGH